MDKIDRFTGEYKFLSNFYIEKDGKSLEHRFQAAKFDHDADRDLYDLVMSQPTPGKAKSVARRYSSYVDADWTRGVSVQVMLTLLREKFAYGSELGEKLIGTGNAWLEEGNHWGDEFYGTVGGRGANVLGMLLMIVRGELLIRRSAEASIWSMGR